MADHGGTDVRGKQAPGFYRFPVGDFEAIALHDGTIVRDRPSGLVRNAGDEQVGEAFAALGMPRDKLTITFSPLAVDTGNGVVLIDTGFGNSGPPTAGMTQANLQAAGIRPEDVRSVIISHFHGDHIMGLRRGDGTPAYPNAQLYVPEPEWAFWTDEARAASAPQGLKDNFALVQKIFGPVKNELRRFGYGEQILPGFTAVDAAGHTPGMAAIDIGPGDGGLTYVADITNNPLLFARNPDWQVVFDMDGDKAVATRHRLLGRAAAEKRRTYFFHAPFPATGYILKSGPGYEFAPALWTAHPTGS